MSWHKDKGGATPGSTDHALLSHLPFDESGHNGFQREIKPWAVGVVMHVNELRTYNGTLYNCIVSHTSSADFLTDMQPGMEKWQMLGSGASTGYLNQYTTNGTITIGTKKNLAIPFTPDFRRLSPDVLKLVSGTQDVVSDWQKFDNSEAGSFNYDNQYVEFASGVMRPKTVYSVPISMIGPLDGTGQYFESDWINSSNFKSIEKTEVI